ncbi:N-acetylmannosamine-6-phosphate 2-epimerase [Streptococcus pluranimalium]|uniref:N-acetylmannosamine-6-phosphate 2-epimerase n=1 Tax=Streptococcus pluranimalium TaxID=82348 RepID=UPI00292F7A31|nr:N-acetylmannosamine-6-phosphate 2-epimerase [Streptococcus pluranimalium]MDY3042092.1 N-acetylmannosamine-6-phosphate 2-epimerase [Streptococcus pluranimalium]HEM6116563.1 N-acetylmannosamine-6-phosphate 2-epimerase [Streptococcus suis]
MSREDILEKLRGGVIISCQALPGEPMYSEKGGVMPLFAKAAKEAGAVGIRANSVRDIVEIQEVVDLPIIGIIKQDYEGADAFITPTMAEVDALVETGVDIIALDATVSSRPKGESLQAFIQTIKKSYPQQLLMADCSTLEEMLTAEKLGFDFIGTTLVGYTEQSKHLAIDANDFEIIRQAREKIKAPIIAEGNISTPEKVKRVFELGVDSVVVGSAITRPLVIAKPFIEAAKRK